MNSIKILTINTVGLNMNGITTVIYDYYSGFCKRFEIHSLSDKSSNVNIIKKFNNTNIKIHIVPSRKKEIKKYFFRLLRLMKENKFDVVHVHGNSATMVIELLAAKLAGCKIRIAHSHNSTCDSKKADKLLRPLFYRLYTDAFACGTAAGRWLFPNREFKTVRNGRDINAYAFNQQKRNDIRQSLGIDENVIAMGHVGNFNVQKNHKFLIDVFKAAYLINPNLHLFLVGYGHCEKDIRDMVNRYKLAQNVHFLGIVDNVGDILQAMDIMLFPSLYEGLPLVVVEWQMAGLPCLISDSITSECIFTELVKFKSLDDSYVDWAEEALAMEKSNRSIRINSQKEVADSAKRNGFDIKADRKDLMEYIINRVKEEL